MTTYRFLCNWELPSLFQVRSPSATELTDIVLATITLVVIGGHVQLMTCRQYLEEFHPKRGLELVKFVLYSLRAENTYIGKLSTFQKGSPFYGH